MLRLRARHLVVVLAVHLSPTTVVATTPAATCEAVKLTAAGKLTRRFLACHVRAVLDGAEVEPACLVAAEERFEGAIAGAEAAGGCPGVGDADDIWAAVDALVAGVRAHAGSSGCAAAVLAAKGRYAAKVFAAWTAFKKSEGDARRFVRRRVRATEALVGKLGRQGCEGAPGSDPRLPDVDALAGGVFARVACGDGERDPAETCDGADDGACPGRCQVDCRCPPDPHGCLVRQGPLVSLAGTHAETYRNDALATETRIDARAGTFLAGPENLYPLNLRGAEGVCVAGGRIRGQYDRSLGWEAMHDMNNAAVRFENAGLTVDGVRADNVTDGIRPVGSDFTIRNVRLSYVRDDCVENDHLQGGLIVDSLLDGCYVAVSSRPSPAIVDSGSDGRSHVVTIRGSLVRLEPMPGPRGGSPTDLGHGSLFKWHELSPALALHDNVFLVEQPGQGGAENLHIPDVLISCAGNVVVWAGAGPYPAPLPTCFTVTNDRAVWDHAVRAWEARHPEVGAS